MIDFALKSWAGWLAALALATPGSVMLAPSPASAAAAPAWVVNKAASRLRFQSSTGGTNFVGAFERWSADIRFDPKNLAGSSVLVKVDMASARTGSSDRDQALPGSDWFDTARFAQATFAAKSFKDFGGGRYQAMGTLAMRGVSRPLTLAFQLQIQGDQARMTGSTTIDRHVFGVGQGQFATADTVPFNVQLSVTIAAKRA